jgi:hypothetical protein
VSGLFPQTFALPLPGGYGPAIEPDRLLHPVAGVGVRLVGVALAAQRLLVCICVVATLRQRLAVIDFIGGACLATICAHDAKRMRL